MSRETLTIQDQRIVIIRERSHVDSHWWRSGRVATQQAALYSFIYSPSKVWDAWCLKRRLNWTRAVNRKWRSFQKGAKHLCHKMAHASCCSRVIILGGQPGHLLNFQSTKSKTSSTSIELRHFVFCANINCAIFCKLLYVIAVIPAQASLFCTYSISLKNVTIRACCRRCKCSMSKSFLGLSEHLKPSNCQLGRN